MSTKRAERFFHLVGLLRSGRGYHSGELAEIMGVSRRTIFRDVVDLSTIVPIYYDDGYRLVPGASITSLALSREELLALRAGVGIPPLSDGSHLAAATRSAVEKIDAQLRQRPGGEEGADALAIYVPSHPIGAQTIGFLRRLEEAARARRTVVITYRSFSSGEETERAVDAYGLTFRRHSWYLVAYCHLRRAERVFRLDRVADVKQTAVRFTRPADFSLDRYFEDAWEVYTSSAKAKVTLAFAPRLAPIARPALARWGKFRAGSGGRAAVFEGTVPLSEEFFRWLLTYGGDVEVLAPAGLRERLGSELTAAAALYAKPRKTTTKKVKK